MIGNGDIFSWDDWHGHCDKITAEVTGGSGESAVYFIFVLPLISDVSDVVSVTSVM